ncbi:MAG: DUF3899 domain-containing protein [Clostridia bacterium]|nr:DUF3899 domain-containing protein [Clostridia bacterium]
MENEKRKKIIRTLLKYGIATLIAAGLGYLFLTKEGYASSLPPVDRYHILCDAFMVPGLLLIMFGLLVFVANTGFFDIFAFSVKKVVRLMFPALEYSKEKFHEYRERKNEEGRVRGYGFLFIVGGVFTLIGAVFLVLFYRYYGV